MNVTQPARSMDAEDYRYSQQVAVVVRWFVLGAWLFLINYRSDTEQTTVYQLNSLAIPVVLLNSYVHWRILVGRPVTAPYVYALSLLDVAVVITGLSITTAFGNTFFVFFYPVLIGFSIVFHRRRVAFTLATLAIGAYMGISLWIAPGVDIAASEERILAARAVSMFAVVFAANLITRIERKRRIEAVEAERHAADENMNLQQQALHAELALVKERENIARDIHDGISQEVYMLNMGLDTCIDLAKRESTPELAQRLTDLMPLAQQTLLHTRNYLYDLKPLFEGKQGLVEMAENQLREFRTVTRIPVELTVEGEPRDLPVEVATALYRTTQEGLANVFKHARARRASLTITFEPDCVSVTIEDDGIGFDSESKRPGNGLGNIRERTEELGGLVAMSTRPGQGTKVAATVPT